jgi:hypothetical protein
MKRSSLLALEHFHKSYSVTGVQEEAVAVGG